jgi:hypothetical protein
MPNQGEAEPGIPPRAQHAPSKPTRSKPMNIINRNLGIMDELDESVLDSDSTRDTLPPKRYRRIIISDTSDSDEKSTGQNLPQSNEEPNLSDAGNTEVSSDSGSSDSNDPVSRKARKYIKRRQQDAQPQNNTASIATTAAITSTTDTENPFTYAMQHGKFPRPVPRQQQRLEPAFLSDPGYLWNAVPPRSSQYLDLEAEHVGSSSAGSTGSSEGSLQDPDFIIKEEETLNEAELTELQRLFPKTFRRNASQTVHQHH